MQTVPRVTLTIVEGPDPRRDAEGWEHNAYTVRLRRGPRSMTVPWRAGMGINRPPSADDVLEALLSDAATIENANGSFDEWAAEFGYDTDSRRAETIFKAATKQTEKLRKFLGDDFDEAVFPPFNTEG